MNSEVRFNWRMHSALALFFLSGVAALGYQLVWTRMFTAGLGHELPATYAVVAAFFAGLAIGAFWLDHKISTSQRPGYWYAALEIIIGIWALLSTLSIGAANDLANQLIGFAPTPLRYWSLAFLIPLVALLPATIAMGATLAAAERWYASLRDDTRQLGRVYAVNTLGAAIGVIAACVLLMPLLGLRQSVLVLSVFSLSAGLAAWLIEQRRQPGSVLESHSSDYGDPAHQLGYRLFITGMLGIGFEVAGIRVMSQIFEGTIYSFAAVLTVYLVGTAVGASFYQRLAPRLDAERWLSILPISLSLACLQGIAMLLVSRDLYRLVRVALGDSMMAVMGAELTLSTFVFLLPTFFMGALFCHLAQAARHNDGGIGWALGINTAGGLIAAPVVGVLAFPALGAKWTLVVIALGYLFLLPRPMALPRWAVAIPILAAGMLPDAFRIVTLRADETLADYREGVMASVAVTNRPNERNLRVNNRFQMGGTSARAMRIQRLQTHVPALLHGSPERILFLGVASGITAGAALVHENARIDVVELVPENIEMLGHFREENRSIETSPRVRLIAGDARRFVRASEDRYDLIVGDLFHPARDGAALLYTREHFQAVRGRLSDNGLYSQWLPIYQMDEAMVRSIVRTFISVFPEYQAWVAGFDMEYPAVALIGSNSPIGFDSERIESRIQTDRALRDDLGLSAIQNVIHFAGHHLADGDALERLADTAPLNTDDRPVVLFEAPQFTYQRGLPSYRSFEPILETVGQQDTHSRLATTFAQPDRRRLHEFYAARDSYLATQMSATHESRDAEINAYIRVAAASADFTLAYAHVANMALGEAESDPETARRWIEALIEVRPEYSVGTQLLNQIDGQ